MLLTRIQCWQGAVLRLVLLGFLSAAILVAPNSLRAAAQSGGITTAICEHPPECFKDKAVRQAWAAKHQCKFLEDICDDPSADKKGAPPEDQGFWGNLWNDVKEALVYGYEFVKGLMEGLKGQIKDLFDLITDPVEVVKGLAKLGNAFYNDPKGTLEQLGHLLGQGVVDSINQATKCGAHGLGKVIGSNINPAILLKIGTRLAKFKTLEDAIADTMKVFDCGSFAAGTPVLTAGGLKAIESITRDDVVLSRDDREFRDAKQKVVNTFGRTADHYYALETEEHELIRLTDEHPLWVQGKGWVPVRDIHLNEILSTEAGDTLVVGLTRMPGPLQVYNFSVENTPSYFVGESGLWAHNIKCVRLTQPTGTPGGKPKGTMVEEKKGANKKKLQAQEDSANILAEAGFDIEYNSKPKPNGKKPDYIMEGKYWDNYAPDSKNLDQVRNYISDKVKGGQTDRVVVNLTLSDFTSKDVEGILKRKDKFIPGLEEVIVITKEGEIVHIYP